MNWTTNAPTEAGWYWLRYGPDADAIPVRATQSLGHLYVQNYALGHDRFTHCQWLGPITPQPGTDDTADLLALLKEARSALEPFASAEFKARIDSAIAKAPPAGGAPG